MTPRRLRGLSLPGRLAITLLASMIVSIFALATPQPTYADCGYMDVGCEIQVALYPIQEFLAAFFWLWRSLRDQVMPR